MRARFIFSSLGILGVLATLHFVEQREQRATIDRLEQQVASLHQTVDRQRGSRFARADRIRPTGSSSSSVSPEAAQAAAAGETEGPPLDTSDDAPPPMDVSDLLASVDDIFVSEAPEGWSRDAVSRVRNAFWAAMPAGSELLEVECRSTMCRIEMLHADNDTYQGFLRELMDDPEKMPWNGAVLTGPLDPTDEAEGPVHAVLYLTREGHEMPDLQPTG